MFQKVFAWVSIFVILFHSMSGNIYAAVMTISGDDVLEEVMDRGWYSETGELRYPITMDDELWKYLFSNENKVKACQIPEDIVMDLSTEELLYMVEEYPNFTITYQDDNPQRGFENMLNNCRALEILLERENCKDVVLAEYCNYMIPAETKYDYNLNLQGTDQVDDINSLIKDEEAMKLVRQDAKERYIISILEMILAQNGILSQFTEYDTQMLEQAILEKQVQKRQSGCFDYTDVNYFAAVAGYNHDIMRYVAEKNIDCIKNVLSADGFELEPLVFVGPTTRSGFIVRFSYTNEILNKPSESEIATYLSSYIDCSLIEIQERGFNCYAYAFLYLDSKNWSYMRRVNVPDPVAFQGDTAYQHLTAAKTGAVAYYSTGHAGIVLNPEHSNGNYTPMPLIASVWNSKHIVVSHPQNQGEGDVMTGGVVYYK